MIEILLRNTNFLYLWLAQILTQTSLSMLYYLLTIKVWENTQSNSAVSLLVLSFTLPAIIFGPIAGVLIDRWDTKKALIITNLVRTFLIPLFALTMQNPFTVVPLLFVVSLVTQFFVPAEGSAIPGIVRPANLLSANSLFTMTFNIATVVGFILSGPLLRLVGPYTTVGVVFVCFAISTFLVTRIPHISGKSGGKGIIAILDELLSALKFIWREKAMRKSVFALTAVNAFIMTLSALGPGFVGQVLKLDVVDSGLILVAPGVVGLVLGSIVLSTYGKDWNEDLLVDFGFLVSGVVLALFSFFSADNFGYLAPILVTIGMFILGVVGSFVNAPATTMLHKMTPEDLRGRIYGVVNTLVNGVSFVPIVVAGGLADLAGVGNVLSLLGVLLLISGIFKFRKFDNKKLRTLVK